MPCSLGAQYSKESCVIPTSSDGDWYRSFQAVCEPVLSLGNCYKCCSVCQFLRHIHQYSVGTVVLRTCLQVRTYLEETLCFTQKNGQQGILLVSRFHLLKGPGCYLQHPRCTAKFTRIAAEKQNWQVRYSTSHTVEVGVQVRYKSGMEQGPSPSDWPLQVLNLAHLVWLCLGYQRTVRCTKMFHAETVTLNYSRNCVKSIGSGNFPFLCVPLHFLLRYNAFSELFSSICLFVFLLFLPFVQPYPATPRHGCTGCYYRGPMI